MKTKDGTGQKDLSASNLKALGLDLKALPAESPYRPLLYVIADCLDHIANGHDMYIVIGSTRNREAYTLNWKGDDAPGPVYGDSLASLSTNCQDLL